MEELHREPIRPGRITAKELEKEFVFSASRSGGPGGQNVNKVNSKVTLVFNVNASEILTPEQKQLIAEKLSSRISNDGLLVITAQENRSQLQNKEEVLVKFDKLLEKAFEKKKPRKASRPTKASVTRRLESKKKNSEKKRRRSGDE